MKKHSLFIILVICYCTSFAQTQLLDSLWKVYNNKSQADTNRLKAVHDIARNYININIDTAFILAKQELQLAQTMGQKKWEGHAFANIGAVCENSGNFVESIGYYLKALKIFEGSGNKKGIATCYGNIGLVYQYQSNYPKALEYLLKALQILEGIGNKKGTGTCYVNIGNVFLNQSNYTKALEYYLKALKIHEEINNKKGISACYGNIGLIYKAQFKYSLALEYFLKDLKIGEEIGDKKGISSSYGNIGAVYYFQTNYPKALEYYLKALKLREETGDKLGIGTCYVNLAELFIEMKDFKKVIQYSDSCIKISKEIGDIDAERYGYNYLSTAYSKTGRYKEAYINHVKFKKLTDSIFNEENSKQLGDMKTNFEVQKKEVELKAKSEAQQSIAAEEKKRQKFVTYSVAGLLILVMLFAGFMFNRFKISQRQKKIIELQKDEVEQQKHLVEEKQKEIVDSITYAKRLQLAILPSYEELRKHLPEIFLLYKPKDIVAGDFYWMEHLDGIIYIAAADSTGHGVPGAMVSVVCSNALNRAVKEFGLRETGQILDKTRDLVLETFAKSSNEVKDGMDISLLSIDKSKKQIYWSGANNQLLYISNKQLLEIKPNKQPIGKTDNPSPFKTHSIEFIKGNIFYLLTDGFSDQFGGLRGKKYKYKQLQEKLLANYDKPLEEQKMFLEKDFDVWMGGLEQVDDVTIIGIKI